jgi:hypothetical protein
MAVHPIKIHFDKGARDCTLKLLEGCGTWGVFGDNNFLTLEIDNPRVIVQVLENHFPPPQGNGITAVRVTVPGIEGLFVSVTRQEIHMELSSWQGDSATFTLGFDSGDRIFFDAWLSRSLTQGMINVTSPDGDETDYLLPNHNKRRVTLPLTPPPEPCE